MKPINKLLIEWLDANDFERRRETTAYEQRTLQDFAEWLEQHPELVKLREAVEVSINTLRMVVHDRPTAHTDKVWERILFTLSKLESLQQVTTRNQ